MQEVYSFDYGIEHSHRTGCLIKTIKLRFVHGYAFTQVRLRFDRASTRAIRGVFS